MEEEAKNKIEPTGGEKIESTTIRTGVEQVPDYKTVIEEFKLQKQAVNELKEELRQEKINSLTVFGIFASFVTFLAVEIQVFKTITNYWLLVGFSSFLLGAILMFAFGLSTITLNKKGWGDFKNPLVILILIFLAIGLFLMYLGSNAITN